MAILYCASYPGVFGLQMVRHNPQSSCNLRTCSLGDKGLHQNTANSLSSRHYMTYHPLTYVAKAPLTLGWKAPCRELKGPVGGSTGWMPGTEGAGYCGKNYTSQPHIHRERLVKTTLLRPLPHSSHHPPQMYKTNTPILEHVNINSQCFCRAPRSCHTSQTKR